MTHPNGSTLHRALLASVLMAALSLFALPAWCDPVVRIVTLTAAGPDQQKELTKVAPAKLYTSAKGCQWVKFFQDTRTLESGSVSLWASQADLDAFLGSDAYKTVFAGKVKPLTKGDASVKVYTVVEPKM